MSFKVTLEPSGHEFEVAADEMILDAAIRKGLPVQYGCRNGVCGACKGKVVEGEIHYPGGLPAAVTEAEHAIGQTLLCCAQARSELVIEMREIGDGGEVKVHQTPARVVSMQRLADDVMELKLKLPDSERLQFLAGQYIDILLADDRRRSFSLANAPHDDELLVLHVRRIVGGEFTGHVFEGMSEGDILRLEGPFGRFTLDEDSSRPIILIAGGTGFAPIKSMIEHAIQEGMNRPLYLYWGAQTEAGLYQDALARDWARRDNISYIPVLSALAETATWTGRRGWVHEAVFEDFADLGDFDIYVSGPPVMVEAVRQGCAERGLPAARLRSDSFEFSSGG